MTYGQMFNESTKPKWFNKQDLLGNMDEETFWRIDDGMA